MKTSVTSARCWATLAVSVAVTVCGCGSAASQSGAAGQASQEPTESQMREAALYAINHPPGMTNADPITIKFFKKEGCENPTPRGFECHFDLQVASANLGASIYNDISSSVFYQDKDSGKWIMRPPF
jgi:hypothetical protein